MATDKPASGARKAIGDVAPELADLTEDILGDHLDQLLLRDAVLDRAREVKAHLLGLPRRDECCAGDQATIALDNVAIQGLVDEKNVDWMELVADEQYQNETRL